MSDESDVRNDVTDDWDDDLDDDTGETADADDLDLDGFGGLDGVDDSELDEETAERIAAVEAEMQQTRERVAQAPAEVVVLNHAMGLYELAAIHLSAQPANLPNAALAIDAFACLVEGLGERLGPEVATLRDALSQIRIAFVQIKGNTAG